MTKETKIKLLLDKYDQEKAELAKEYKKRSDEIKVSAGGEVSASQTLELNFWHTEEQGKIEDRFIRAIMALEG